MEACSYKSPENFKCKFGNYNTRYQLIMGESGDFDKTCVKVVTRHVI